MCGWLVWAYSSKLEIGSLSTVRFCPALKCDQRCMFTPGAEQKRRSSRNPIAFVCSWRCLLVPTLLAWIVWSSQQSLHHTDTLHLNCLLDSLASSAAHPLQLDPKGSGQPKTGKLGWKASDTRSTVAQNWLVFFLLPPCPELEKEKSGGKRGGLEQLSLHFWAKGPSQISGTLLRTRKIF